MRGCASGRATRSRDRKSTRLNSSHLVISYAVFCLTASACTPSYALSLHDALPIFRKLPVREPNRLVLFKSLSDAKFSPGGYNGVSDRDESGRTVRTSFPFQAYARLRERKGDAVSRSEEHTSELQSPCNLVCRLLLDRLGLHPFLRSFPTRRSSDLQEAASEGAQPARALQVFVGREVQPGRLQRRERPRRVGADSEDFVPLPSLCAAARAEGRRGLEIGRAHV